MNLIKLKKLAQHSTVHQGAKYVIVGGVCTLVDVTILFLLTKYLGINYLLSSIFSFSAGVLINYFLCVIWIFDFRAIESRAHEFLYYFAITLGALGINTLIIWFLTNFFTFYFLISKLFASLITLIYNFILRKYFLHTPR